MKQRTSTLLKNHNDLGRPLRILHVVGGMNRGGIETWLMHVLRHIDRDRFQMNFLVHQAENCAYDEEIRTLGSRIIPCLQLSQPWIYACDFKQILREYGSYDIVHSHVHHFSGYVLRLAQEAGVPVCIAHSHNDTSAIESHAGFSRQLYLTFMKRWINCYATLGLGCSRKAVADLFGKSWETDSRWQILNYGIDLNPFHNFSDRVRVRTELGIPLDAFVIGHVGRFQEQKNHEFLLKIAAQVARREPKMYLLLVGEGVLQEQIKEKVLQMGLGDRVIFAGSQPDIPRLMRGAMDVFLFPSLHEGLGIVLIEAQAAGLPSIFSDVVPEEVDVVKPLLRRMSLSQSASEWAEMLLAQKNAVSILPQSDALALMKKSSFSIQASMQQLQNIYQTSLVRGSV